ncbi:MAG: hypothetical protein JWM20_164 [Patescibacteria group bacterium]|nr:hypothetical protein [Patescibacteria group bacterium]
MKKPFVILAAILVVASSGCSHRKAEDPKKYSDYDIRFAKSQAYFTAALIANGRASNAGSHEEVDRFYSLYEQFRDSANVYREPN